MTIWRLVFQEIRFRKLAFLLGALAVAVAVGCLVSQIFLLEQHDRRTEQLLAEKQKATKEAMDLLEKDYRLITRDLGFNLRILPKDVNLVDFYAKDYADKYMPENYVDKLAQAKVVTVNHLLPILQKRLEWPEQECSVMLVGTRGEVPIQGGDDKKPLLEAVAPGKIVLGYQLQRQVSRTLGEELQVGDAIKLAGRKLTVQRLNKRKGDLDDITVWVALKEAQEMLNKPGLINVILALECNCSGERLPMITQEVAALLPDTQVVEWETKATARALARNRAALEAAAALEREKTHRAQVRAEKESFAAVLAPLVLVGALLLLGLLAWNNVRERRGEIGLFRALGYRTEQILRLFLTRAALVGLMGAVLGLAGGVFAGGLLGESGGQSVWGSFLELTPFLGMTVLTTPAACMLACWLPALAAARQDPAVVLQQESM